MVRFCIYDWGESPFFHGTPPRPLSALKLVVQQCPRLIRKRPYGRADGTVAVIGGLINLRSECQALPLL